MTRITISLKELERTALRALAEKEFRDPRQQAALIIRQELERRGLLTVQNTSCPIEVFSTIPPKVKPETK